MNVSYSQYINSLLRSGGSCPEYSPKETVSKTQGLAAGEAKQIIPDGIVPETAKLFGGQVSRSKAPAPESNVKRLIGLYEGIISQSKAEEVQRKSNTPLAGTKEPTKIEKEAKNIAPAGIVERLVRFFWS